MEIEIIDQTGQLSTAFHELIHELLTYSGQYLRLPRITEISVTIVSDEAIQVINRDYRGKDYATDVISFAMNDVAEDDPVLEMALDEELKFDHILGDLIISLDKVKSQAKEYGHTQKRELAFLLVHGFLHLNGYDHHTKAAEQEMFELQETILAEFGISR